MDKMTKVLIVDDSAFARFAVSKQLGADPGIEIVGTARDGIDALEKIAELKPDVITLDIEMPRLDGLATLKRIMSDFPTPVVMLSSLTDEGTEATLTALNSGAVDFFLKSSPAAPAGLSADVVDDLVAKIKMAARADVSRLAPRLKPFVVSPEKIAKPRKPRSSVQRRVVVIGSSTGGPRALQELLPLLPGDIPATMLVVQHMPPGFTRSLAERLNEVSEIDVKEAQEGDALCPGMALFAPGGSHIQVDKEGRIRLDQGPTECGLRPAANVTMDSVARFYGQEALGVVLTGMGSDGTRGARLIKEAGGEMIVEAESTCVVYGMPKSVVDAGYADAVLPLSQIAEAIEKRCQVDCEKVVEV